jgi:glucokinase
LDGQIFHGHRYAAGEVGHITILPDGPLCGCGNYGCVEALASGSAIARRVKEMAPKNRRSVLYALHRKNPDDLTARTVFQAARQGDGLARHIVEETARYLGIAIASSINLLNPELVIIGGGVARAGEMLLKPIRAEIGRRAMKDTLASVKIVPAQLGDQAGVIGAAGIAILAKAQRNSNPGRRRKPC